MDTDGGYRNTTLSETSPRDHWGSQYTTYNQSPTIEPLARSCIYKLHGPSGEDIHQLIPVQYRGHNDYIDFFGDPRRGRFMNFYRTSDNSFDRGDVIIDGTTRYRVFKCHKTGQETQNNAIQNACYAFPEDNVPF